MAQSFGDKGQFGINYANDGTVLHSIPIIATVSLNGIPTINGIIQRRKEDETEEEHQLTIDESLQMVESTFILEEGEEEEEEEEIPDIDVEVEEEVMLMKLYKGAPNAEIETIEEEEEPMEEEESGREREKEERWKRVDGRETERVKEGEGKGEKQKWNREAMDEKVEERWKRVRMEEEQRDGRETDRVEEGGGKEEEKEVGVAIELVKEKEESAEVLLDVAEGTVQKQQQQIVFVVPHKQMPDQPMAVPLPEENASKTVSIVNEVQASTSTVETTVWQRSVVEEGKEQMTGLKQVENGGEEGRVGAVHVRQRMMDNGGTFEEETPFLELNTTQTVWREQGEVAGGGQTEGTARKMNGAEERRKLAEGEAMLRQLMQENNAKDQTVTEQTEQMHKTEPYQQQTEQKMSRNVTIERHDLNAEPKREEKNVQIVHIVKLEQKEQQPQFRHDSLYALAKNEPTANNRMDKHNQMPFTAITHNHYHTQSVADRTHYSPSPHLQNGTTSASLIARSPGPHSPFGLEPPAEDDEWRLSPKTLSRIKRLNVVMETDGKESADVIHHHPVFVKDTSRYWYKPTISREEAIAMLKDKPPRTFIVRDSNSFPGAFGLALKVAQPPAGVPSSADGNELVRHFLIEPSPKGVRLKGCSNEPVFGTLAALVYQHSITPLALPCRLILPEFDPAATPEHLNSNQALLERGAACNVTFLCSVDTESLTGPEALRRSTAHCFELLQRRELRAVSVHFKVSSQGITLTDNTRSMFFRRHYPANKVTFAGIDPESRVFDNNNVSQLPPTYVRQAPIFGFVARKCVVSDHSGSVDNACHLFAELDPDQPASAVVRFITNVMMPIGRAQLHQIHQNVNSQ
ncbi:hypothetical protein niasHT_015478 [Heterodera trifolii]|uniref:SH2 domain-containing protein n=1 Tax=Heterodera trifolii TaxID=157864 RepID=A0ABD2L058_9BILA